MADAQIQIVVTGLVQGVGYRYYVCREAATLNLKGTVRNRHDGSVEVVAEGDTFALHALLDSVKIGPRFGHITTVNVNWLPFTGEFHTFSIIH
jgi:acylphosphatase